MNMDMYFEFAEAWCVLCHSTQRVSNYRGRYSRPVTVRRCQMDSISDPAVSQEGHQ
jgi:hypothetical protein